MYTPQKDMLLPKGKTCKDCLHFQRTCEWLISCDPNKTSCDWSPSRFLDIKPTVVTESNA